MRGRSHLSKMAPTLSLVPAAVLLLGVATADAASALRAPSITDRGPGVQSNRAGQGALGQPRQSLKPTPGEVRGLGSRWPDPGVAPGTPGNPRYYPRAMRPIEPQ